MKTLDELLQDARDIVRDLGPAQMHHLPLLANRAEAAIRAFIDLLDPSGATFYSRTPHGYEEHDTAAEARDTAQAHLEPDGEWPEDIERTQWGVLIPLECTIESHRTETPEGEFDYMCSYELTPVDVV